MIEAIKKIEEKAAVNRLKEEHGIESLEVDTFDTLISEYGARTDFITEDIGRLEQELASLEVAEKRITEPRYSWIQKNITKRKEYLESQQKYEQEKENCANKIASLKQQLDTQKITLDTCYKILAEVRDLKKDFDSKKNCFDFGYTFAQALDLIQSHGEKLVLTEADKEGIVKRDTEQITSLDKLVLVHKTNYMPRDNRIETPYEAYKRGAFDKEDTIELNGETYNYIEPSARKTIHFSVNGPVSEHLYGNAWSSMPYAIFIPFNDIPREQIAQAPPMDTYTNGSVELTQSAYILCPEGEEEEILKMNPILKRENVIGYRCNNLSSPASIGFENFIISNVLECKPEQIGMWNWVNEEDAKKYSELMKENGFGTLPHSATEEYKREDIEKLAMIWSKIIGILRKESISVTPEVIDKIFDKIPVSQGFTYIQGENVDCLREMLTNILIDSNLPAPESLHEEDLKTVGIKTDVDDVQKLFRECFNDAYQPLFELKKQQLEQDCVECFCLDVVHAYGDIKGFMDDWDFKNASINPLKKDLKDMSLTELNTIKSNYDCPSIVHLIATNEKLQRQCNEVFKAQGVPLVINYDGKYSSMDPNEAVISFFSDCCNRLAANQLTAEVTVSNKK